MNFSLINTPLGGQQEYGAWKEVITTTIEMSASVGGFGKGEARQKLGNSLNGPKYFDDQEKNFVRLVLV
jgi:hypothetical protein